MAKRKHRADACSQVDPLALTEFEQARLQRIQHNKQVLASMGLESAADSLSAAIHPSAKRAKCSESDTVRMHKDAKQQQEPTRRSQRLANEPPAVLKPIDLNSTDCARQLSDISRVHHAKSAASNRVMERLDPDAHHNHNVHRIRTMSEKALITRAWKITNVGKLKSFVEVLEAAGDMEAVLLEAKAALAALTGQ